MNLERIEEYVGGTGGEYGFLVELAKRVLELWGCPEDDLVAMSLVWIMTYSTVMFVDGFGLNDPSDLDSFPGVSGASAVVAALWGQGPGGWLDVKRMYRPKTAPTDDIEPTVRRLLVQASSDPRVALVE